MRNTIEIARHLPDQDDLRLDRDGPLDPEYHHLAIGIAEKIIAEAEKEDKKVVAFVVSPKKRAVQSVELIRNYIKEKKNGKIRTIVNIDQDIREIDQGKFILPQNYSYGDNLLELSEAGRVFFDQSANKKNYTYHFGDPELQDDGTYKHPEFANFFSEYGESYLEQNIRLYKAILKLYEYKDRLSQMKLVVVTHGAPLSIYKELETIAIQILKEDFNPEIGTIMDLTWEYYKKRAKEKPSAYGRIETIDVSPILNEKIIGRLRAEIEYMEQKNV